MTLGYRQRIHLLAALMGAVLLALVVRLFWMQVVDHRDWERKARAQVARWLPIRARRGRILDRNGAVLATDEAGFDLVVRAAAWKGHLYVCDFCGARRYQLDGDENRTCRRCRRKELAYADRRDLRPVARLLRMPERELLARILARVTEADEAVERAVAEAPPRRKRRRRASEWADHGWRDRRIARDVPYEVAREVELHPERNPAFRIRTVHTRRVPGGRDFAHVAGRVREEVRRVAAPDGSLQRVRDSAGELGLEGRFDRELRGLPGWIKVRRDPRNRGRELVERHAPVHGLDLELTLARGDQRAAVAALGGYHGAFIVIEARTGAVLAMASSPSYEPDRYRDVLLDLERRRKAEGRYPTHHALNDAVAWSFFVPGSIFKPFTAVAGLTGGVAAPSRAILCEGFFRNRSGTRIEHGFKCGHVHGEVSLEPALVSSCNIYFQTLMADLIEARKFPHFERTCRAFGFGLPTGLETERADFPDRLRFREKNWWGGAVLSAIGQGWIELSPAQVARAYAGLATGVAPRLHVVRRVGSRGVAPLQGRSLGVDESLLGPIREALLDVPRHGTAKGYRLETWRIACKTGTAQRTSREGERSYNAWMAGFAPAQEGRPAIAFAMVVLDTPDYGADACGPKLAEFFTQFYGDSRE